MKEDHNTSKSVNPCQTYMDMFSPAIDDELLPLQREELDRHLQICPRCSSEFAVWQDISNSLRNIPPVPAPENFTRSVMAGISGADKIAPVKKRLLTGFGRRGIAAAAAGVLLMAGSMGLYGAFNLSPPGSELAAGKKIPAVEQPLVNNPASPAAGGGAGDAGDISPTRGTAGTQVEKTGGGEQRPPADNKPDPGRNSGGKQPAAGATRNAASAPTALLSEKIAVNSTLVKIKSQDPAVVAEQAANLAQRYGAGANYMVNQSTDSRTVVVLRIDAANKNAGMIAGRLAAMGILVENSSSSQDITSQYQQALARRQELNELIASSGDQEQHKYMDELEAVNMQIEEWNKASSRTSIMFWVEK